MANEALIPISESLFEQVAQQDCLQNAKQSGGY